MRSLFVCVRAKPLRQLAIYIAGTIATFRGTTLKKMRTQMVFYSETVLVAVTYRRAHLLSLAFRTYTGSIAWKQILKQSCYG